MSSSGFWEDSSTLCRTLMSAVLISLWVGIVAASAFSVGIGAILPAIAAPILHGANVQSGRADRPLEAAIFNGLVFSFPAFLHPVIGLVTAGCAIVCGAAGSTCGWSPKVSVSRCGILTDLLTTYSFAVAMALISIPAATVLHARAHHCDTPIGRMDGLQGNLAIEYNDKPVIYLYPKLSTPATVQVNFNGTIEATYPRIGANNTWTVTAHPDGRIQDSAGEYHRYLFWEGRWGSSNPLDRNEGFIVRGSVIDHFLRGKLRKLGLTSLETDDFITYWYPILRKRKRLHIYFSQLEYGSAAQLAVTPKPDSEIRFLMVFRDAPEGLELKPQKLIHHSRRGFTLVEWGGMELKKHGAASMD